MNRSSRRRHAPCITTALVAAAHSAVSHCPVADGTTRTIANGQVHGRGRIEWLSPPGIIRALGEFDLDPCAPAVRPWPTARQHFTIDDDGLSQKWHGRVWLNPPYDNHAERWLAKLAEHGNGIALIFARTETRSFFANVWQRASALLFIRGRLQFHMPDGSLPTHTNCGAPSVLVAYGIDNAVSLHQNYSMGQFLSLRCTHE